jgi:signal transduction histidine kinase
MPEPSDRDLLDRLAAHKTLGDAPRAELLWLLQNGTFERFEPGHFFDVKPDGTDHLMVMLTGRMAIYLERAGTRRRVMEWRGGEVTGWLPYSRMTPTPIGDLVIEEPTEAVLVHRRHFHELIVGCPTVTATLVHVMLDRARAFNSTYLHDEKMVSLGKLSAGLAHELNNPASAASRSAQVLAAALVDGDRASETLLAAKLNDEQLAAIKRVREECGATAALPTRSPIDRADREDELGAWLDAHGLDAVVAGSLADTCVTREALDALARVVNGPALDAAIRWTAARTSAPALAAEIEQATSRIYQLVAAVKGFTYMDRATVPEPVDVARGLTDTLHVLGAKAQAKAVGMRMRVETDLPPVRGYGGELNQVWANLLDNALDAATERGEVEVSARREGAHVLVRVVDDGPGIPAEIASRVFDPFFTTKPLGQGTGLGLDIVRRLVRHNDGEVELESRPGRTEFRVRLPVLEARPATFGPVSLGDTAEHPPL